MTVSIVEKLNIEENYPLRNVSNFHIGGPAKYYVQIDNDEQLASVLQWANEQRLPLMILGGGTNVLISDKGFDGLVIHLQYQLVSIEGTEVLCSADINLMELVNMTVDKGLTGIEFAAGIPGSVGGGVVGNAGAYGGQLSDVVVSAEVMDRTGEVHILSNQQLNFTYRHSLLKEKSWLLLRVTLKLEQGDREEAMAKVARYNADRWSKQPTEPSAGCTFKNIIITDEIIKLLQKHEWEIPEQYFKYNKIPVAWIIDRLGLKGKRIGDAELSSLHGNFIINKGQAKAEDVVTLISLIKQEVRDQLGIQLEEEVRYLGF
ncbi:MAG: UDP-N-acetylmuramate dehydrogenase [Candidatus Komeilibacteria bacterium]|nr:UDP-N-acetylmuramate dehydrogenase [Candidatus Komeilibacteria bacterium]